MKKLLKLAITLPSILVITSCSMIYDGDNAIIQHRDKDYLKATSIPPIKVPAGLSSKTIHASYPVTAVDYPEESKKVSLVPPGLNDR